MDQNVKFPVWFDHMERGHSDVRALKDATGLSRPGAGASDGIPPIVINITDGEATDGDLVAEARN